MSKPVIVAIVVIAAIVVGIPLLGNVMKSSSGSSGDSEATSSGGESAPAATAAPGLDANSLTNTQWSIKIQGFPVTVSFLPGGALQAQSPVLKAIAGSDTVGGTWTVSGANLNITAAAGDKTVNETFVISGDQILVKGSPAQRLR